MDGYKNERENYQEEIQFVTVEIGHPVPVLCIPSSKRTRLSASARRETNWSINCVMMRVMGAVKETTLTFWAWALRHSLWQRAKARNVSYCLFLSTSAYFKTTFISRIKSPDRSPLILCAFGRTVSKHVWSCRSQTCKDAKHDGPYKWVSGRVSQDQLVWRHTRCAHTHVTHVGVGSGRTLTVLSVEMLKIRSSSALMNRWKMGAVWPRRIPVGLLQE